MSSKIARIGVLVCVLFVTRIAAAQRIGVCQESLGDGIAIIPAGTYSFIYIHDTEHCKNLWKVRLKVTTIGCKSNTSEDVTADVRNRAQKSFLAKPIICGKDWTYGVLGTVKILGPNDAFDWSATVQGNSTDRVDMIVQFREDKCRQPPNSSLRK